MNLKLLLFVLMLSGCATTPVDTKTNTDASQMMVNSLKVYLTQVDANHLYYGVGILPAQTSYKLFIQPRRTIKQVSYETCAQSYVDQSASTKMQNGVFEIDLTVDPTVETASSCRLKISVVEDNADAEYAYLEFQDKRPEAILTGRSTCNEFASTSNGVTICQAHAGLVHQTIAFSYPVKVPSVPGCNDMTASSDGKSFSYIMSSGECVYYFTAEGRATENNNRLIHRLRTLGYTAIPTLH